MEPVTGTGILSNINLIGSSNPAELTSTTIGVLFQANNGTNGLELWRTDGTNTTQVADLVNGFDGDPKRFTEIGTTGIVVFSANISDVSTPDYELWTTDGSTATAIGQINNTGSSNPSRLTYFNNNVFFTAFNGSTTDLYSTEWRNDCRPNLINFNTIWLYPWDRDTPRQWLYVTRSL